MKKKLLVGLLVAVTTLSVACSPKGNNEGASAGKGDKVYTIKLGTVLPETDELPLHMIELSESLKELTNGQINVEVLAAGLLGDTAEVLEQAQSGMNVGVVLDAGRFADYVPQMNIFEAPYIFNDYNEALKFTKSDMFQGWVEDAEKYGMHISAWNWYQGPRHFWTQKELTTLDDFKNLKIRTGTSPMWQEIIKSFGATPVSIAGNEVYSALQQKVVDGMEAQLLPSGNYEEVLSHITKTEHFLLLTGIAISDEWYKSLPEDLQVIFDEEVVKFGEKYSQHTLDNQEVIAEQLINRGFTINEFDLDILKEASEKVYDKFEGFKALKEEIRSVVEGN